MGQKKKKNLFIQIWEWFLDMGLANAILFMNLVVVICVGAALAFLRWLLGRH